MELGWETPQKENTPGGGSDRGIPGGHTVLLRGDEGLAPLDQEARNSKSTHLLHQGTEMVGTRGGLTMTALEGALSHCPVVVRGWVASIVI